MIRRRNDGEVEFHPLEDLELDVDIEDQRIPIVQEHENIAPTTDDPSAPSLTFRVLLLGTLWCIFLGGVNALLAFRTNAFEIPSFLATLLSYPMGILFATALPRKSIRFFGIDWQLNPGPFGLKEHVLITIIASAGGTMAYGIDNVVAQKSSKFMGNESITFLESLGWVLTTQFLGFGMAVIKPSAMLWPGILSTVALFVGFHSEHSNDTHSQYKLSRLPQYFVVILQSFSPLCLLGFSRDANFLFSSENGYGLGLGSLTLDCTLTTPWWATVNMAMSNYFWAWFLTPLAFMTNLFGADQTLSLHKYPDGTPVHVLNSAALFNSTGHRISAVSLYQPVTFDLNEQEYQKQAPIYITPFFALVYGASFLSIVSAFSHVFLWHGKDIKRRFFAALNQLDDASESRDIHNICMKRYPDVSEFSFIVFLFGLFLLQILISSVTPFEMPIWAVTLCMMMSMLSILPIGIITAISGQRLGVNVLTEFAIGLLLPGKTVIVMAFKSLGTNSVKQAITLLADLKLGHYMKINPQHMIFAQLYGSLIGAVTNTACTFWVLDSMKDTLGTGDWQMTNYFLFYNAGAIWGAIGPSRFFGSGSPYQSLLWCFLIGLALPFIPWILNKYYPNPFWCKIHVPLLASFSGPGQFQNFYIVPVIVAWFFQSHLYRNFPAWHAKYNYILAVALDSGVGITVLCVTILEQLDMFAPKAWYNPA
ncbi:hypothetical protein HDV02_004028 [Globomyces sp. JEL0801]|nr:hypothetical protein HDV02_004028 [Globomyces sp. JEL0801]